MNCKSNSRAVILAAIAASFMMLCFGMLYRVMAAPVNRTVLDRAALEGFPLKLGDWVGQEVPVDKVIEQVMDADTYVCRRYSRQNGLESVSLYFPCGTDVPELLQHVPENCYTGAGWILADRRSTELTLKNGSRLPCSIVQFVRDGLEIHKIVLLHFLVADGEYFTTFSAVARVKGWRHFATIGYAAQVQIVTSADNVTIDAATKVLTDFALDAVPAMEQFFSSLAAARTAKESHID